MFYNAYLQFKKGIMPWSGGFAQQANSFVSNSNYFDAVIGRYNKVKAQRGKGGK